VGVMFHNRVVPSETDAEIPRIIECHSACRLDRSRVEKHRPHALRLVSLDIALPCPTAQIRRVKIAIGVKRQCIQPVQSRGCEHAGIARAVVIS